MTKQEKELLNGPLMDYLLTLGVSNIDHTNGKFLPHLKGLSEYLERYNRPFPTVIAGLFHSIYGTETFNGFSLPLERREEVREVIGIEAEALVYTYCRMSQASFDMSVIEGKPCLRDRDTQEIIATTPKQFTELQWMMLLDTLEVDARVSKEEQWTSRINFWRTMSYHLDASASKAINEVYGSEKFQVKIAQKYRSGAMFSLGNASYMLLSQDNFPLYFDDRKEEICSHDLDRLQIHNENHVKKVLSKYNFEEHSLEYNIRDTKPEILFYFVCKMLKQKRKDWTGYRILGTVGGNGHNHFTFQLFKKDPLTDTEVYSGDEAPNVQ